MSCKNWYCIFFQWFKKYVYALQWYFSPPLLVQITAVRNYRFDNPRSVRFLWCVEHICCRFFARKYHWFYGCEKISPTLYCYFPFCLSCNELWFCSSRQECTHRVNPLTHLTDFGGGSAVPPAMVVWSASPSICIHTPLGWAPPIHPESW